MVDEIDPRQVVIDKTVKALNLSDNAFVVNLYDYKYTYINDNGRQLALRHGEEWQAQELSGNNLVMQMGFKIEELQNQVAELNASLEKEREGKASLPETVADFNNYLAKNGTDITKEDLTAAALNVFLADAEIKGALPYDLIDKASLSESVEFAIDGVDEWHLFGDVIELNVWIDGSSNELSFCLHPVENDVVDKDILLYRLAIDLAPAMLNDSGPKQ